MNDQNSKVFPPSKGINKGLEKLVLKSHKKDFNETQNPLFIWRAYQVCRVADLSIPKWVLEKLDLWAENIIEIDPGRKRHRDLLYEALEMNMGSRSPWKKIEDNTTREDYVIAYLMMSEERNKTNHPRKRDSAIKEDLGKLFHVSPKTIEHSISDLGDKVTREYEDCDGGWFSQ